MGADCSLSLPDAMASPGSEMSEFPTQFADIPYKTAPEVAPLSRARIRAIQPYRTSQPHGTGGC